MRKPQAKPTGKRSRKAGPPEGFDAVPHLRHRLFLPSLLGLNVLAVYDALRSLTWREEAYGPAKLVERLREGFLVAQADYEKLALMTGLGRGRIREHLSKLENIGWLIPHRQGNRSSYYELGVRREAGGGRWAEVPYADGVMTGWHNAVVALAQSQHQMQLKSLSPVQQKALVAQVLEASEAAKTAETSTSKNKDLRAITQQGFKSVKSPTGTSQKSPTGTTAELEISCKSTKLQRKSDATPVAIPNRYNRQRLRYAQSEYFVFLLPVAQSPDSAAGPVASSDSLRSSSEPTGPERSSSEFTALAAYEKFRRARPHPPPVPPAPLPLHAAPLHAAFAFAPGALPVLDFGFGVTHPQQPACLEAANGPSCEADPQGSTSTTP